MRTFSSIVIAIVTLAIIACVRAQNGKFSYVIHSAPAIDIKSIDITPIPILHPGEAFLTFEADLKRPINTIATALKIVRTVSGIKLPVNCYKVEGLDVGSCNYTDLCVVLKTMLPSFKPETCPAAMAIYGIDCNCPFKIPAGKLNIIQEKLVLPDAKQSIASFMATGDFAIRLDTSDQQGPYAALTVNFSVKPKPSAG
ncbi:unnamed protein product [Rotaria socialis]|uniref:Ganglioside GM2 activator n=1 Tax=Rotaria socialis TaxID=392032 RepID=A0A817UU81_9BILA|nr:unnamed protein product [Rotaria socialis]CAF3335939.1 unnamed protein product [Rotaria socialis]CAF3358384.1 unnamed protein product [Rotaria socialis]CAF3644148.1 unnamed protein product [Rotaria socialis]CAF4325342.1 unnamed protein product [Rotaria socialis]